MKIQVDDSPLLVPISGNTLGPVLGTIFDLVEARQRGIISLQIDGTTFRAENIDESLMARPLATIQRLDIVSETIACLALQTLDRYDESIQDLALCCHEISEFFHDPKSTLADESIEDLQGLWAGIAGRHNDLAAILGTPLEDIALKTGNMRDHRVALDTQMRTMLKAWENKDRVTVSDLLEYELAPLAEVEAELSAVLRERLEAHQA